MTPSILDVPPRSFVPCHGWVIPFAPQGSRLRAILDFVLKLTAVQNETINLRIMKFFIPDLGPTHRTMIRHKPTTSSPQKHHQKKGTFSKTTLKTGRKRTKKAPATAGAFLSRIRNLLDAEARSTPAGRLHCGILKFEARRLQCLHIVHGAILQVHRRGRVHKHL